MSTFREKTISGVAWSVVSKGGQQALTLVITVVLARLLTPEDFGLVAMITVLTGFAGIFFDLGLGASLIHKQDLTEAHRSSVFWVNVLAGLVLTGGFMIAAPWVAAFYDEPMLHPLTQLMAVIFLVRALKSIQSTLVRKKLDFRTLAIAGIISSCISGAVAIAMAIAGFGVWSLVVMYLVNGAVSAGVLWRWSGWLPTLIIDRAALGELLGFSVNMLGTRVLNYWTRRSDNLLIGWQIGSEALGLYSRAYALLLFPLINVTRVIAEVMFPSFSIIQKDKERIRGIYLRATRVIALVTFPMTLGLLVTARPFVLAVFGAQWVEMVPMVQVFALVGLVQSISTTSGVLYLSQGRADLQFKVGFVVRTLLIVGIVAGLRWGAFGVAVGYGLASVVGFYPDFYYAGRLVNLSFSKLLRNLLPVAACAAAMGAVVKLEGWLLLTIAWAAWAQLPVQVATGAAVYLALVYAFEVAAYQDARVAVEERLSAWRGGAGEQRPPEPSVSN